MKKSGFILFLVCVPALLWAQLDASFEKKHTISGGMFMKVDSMSDKRMSFWPEIYGTYESNLSERLAGFFRMNVIIPMSMNIQKADVYGDTISKQYARGFGMTLGARYYINAVMHGFYVGPSVGYYRYNQTYEYENCISDDEFSITSVRGSMVLGYQYVYNNGFTIHAYAGIMLDRKSYAEFITVVKTVPVGSISLLKPDVGLSFGYYF
ncbi:MAG: DUF3575 domain-containing protein [Candidatus Delongbacteria bacterium]|nr:DUF3575 domain-containing protein [Candidatus Delongbacteria bacterium]